MACSAFLPWRGAQTRRLWLVCGIILVVLWLSAIPVARAGSQQPPCSDQFTRAPGSPERLEQLLALREAPPAGGGTATYVRLHWVKPGDSRVNCVALQKSEPRQAAETWTTIALIDTAARPNASQWLHRDTPERGQICYRAYAANELGRSDYSDVVCLMLGPDFPPPTPWPSATQSPTTPTRPAPGDSTANLALLLVVIGSVAVLFAVAFSRLWLRR